MSGQAVAGLQRRALRNLLAAEEAVSPEHWQQGRAWYPEAASSIMQEAAGLPPAVALGTVAIHSARTGWQQNRARARAVFRQGPAAAVGTAAQRAAVQRLWQSGNFLQAVGTRAPKVTRFGLALAGLWAVVPIDTWNFGILLGRQPSDADRHALDRADRAGPHGLYRLLEAVWIARARALRQEPAQHAAALWISVRGRAD
jgi:hypothetical protein